MDYVFSLCIFYAFTYWGLLAPPKVNQFLETLNTSGLERIFLCRPINPEPCPPMLASVCSHPPGHDPPALNPRARHQLGTVPLPQSPLK